MAVERVEKQLREVTAALDAVGLPYAVIGGNAVAAWVASIDPAAVRTTKDVDLLVDRDHLAQIQQALAPLGYQFAETQGVGMFLPADNPNPKSGVHLLYSGELLNSNPPQPAPPTSAVTTDLDTFRVITLAELIRMKLAAFRDRDRVHLRDMIDAGLLDRGWIGKFSSILQERLQLLFDSPE